MKKILVLSTLLIMSLGLAKAQRRDDSITIEEPVTAAASINSNVYTSPEKNAEFPGGLNKFYDYLSRTVRYSKKDRAASITGKLIVSFIIEKDGSISEIKFLRSLSEDSSNELTRVLKDCPKWIPAQNKGIVVRQTYTLPLSINLLN